MYSEKIKFTEYYLNKNTTDNNLDIFGNYLVKFMNFIHIFFFQKLDC